MRVQKWYNSQNLTKNISVLRPNNTTKRYHKNKKKYKKKRKNRGKNKILKIIFLSYIEIIEPEDFYKKTKAVNKRLAIYGVARIAESCTEYNGRIKYRVQRKVYKPVLV